MKKLLTVVVMVLIPAGIVFIPYGLGLIYTWPLTIKYELLNAAIWFSGILNVFSVILFGLGAWFVLYLIYSFYKSCKSIAEDIKIPEFKTLKKEKIKNPDTVYGGLEGALSFPDYEETEKAKIIRNL